MANTDIFNASTGVDPVLGFNTNWSYGGPRNTMDNFKETVPRFGRPWARSVSGDGYSFDLIFTGRSIEQVKYIQYFYRQFRNGFFTLIDHDNGGRQHVGRFTKYQDDTETKNLQYTVRVTFTESQGALMLEYPSDWANSSHTIYCTDDYVNPATNTLNATAATFAQNAGGSGTSWTLVQSSISANPTDSTSYLNSLSNPTAGDFAQVEYVGWGFQMTFPIATAYGLCNVFLDGSMVASQLDLSGGACASSSGVITVNSGATAVTLLMQSVPLGRHRVKVVALAQVGVNSVSVAPIISGGVVRGGYSATGVVFPPLQVMH